jgi:uncharacterized protein with PQ loop repeat
MSILVDHHFLKRKQGKISSKQGPLVSLLDRLIFVVGTLGPISASAQVYKIWIEKTAEGVSIITWLANFLFSIVWVIYGIIHKEKSIIFTYALWMLINGLIALGAFIYS